MGFRKLKQGIIQMYRPGDAEGKIVEDGGTKSYTFKTSDIIVKFVPKVGQKVWYKIAESRKRKAVSIQPCAYD